MSVFQLIGLGFVAALLLACARGMIRGKITGHAGGGWLLLWLGTGMALAYPELTAIVARALGIGRGADLVFYCSILAMLVGFFLVYSRLQRIETNITKIVRHIAINEAALPEEILADLQSLTTGKGTRKD